VNSPRIGLAVNCDVQDQTQEFTLLAMPEKPQRHKEYESDNCDPGLGPSRSVLAFVVAPVFLFSRHLCTK
jgi:hypothetical protein